MRCHYLSDLHLESQGFDTVLPTGDVLIIAGDLCHARCLDPLRADRYSMEQRTRVLRLRDQAARSFAHVLLIAGNHEHYDGVFEDTTELLGRHLPGVKVLNDEVVEIGGLNFYGATLWTDFAGRSVAAMSAVRRRMGEYFFVKTSRGSAGGPLAKFQPEDALSAHDAAQQALRQAVSGAGPKPTVIITHHAPSALGLNRRCAGNGLDAAYASNLDAQIEAFENVPVWVHGHTHIARTYRLGRTLVCSNALGFAARGQGAAGFSTRASFTLP